MDFINLIFFYFLKEKTGQVLIIGQQKREKKSRFPTTVGLSTLGLHLQHGRTNAIYQGFDDDWLYY